VEAPNVEEFLGKVLAAIQRHGQANGLPIQVHHVRPEPNQTFWVNLIGKGYPSPTRTFRWCTTKMKIRPARKVIEDVISNAGSVILLLGTRIAESSERGQRMEARQQNERGLNPHHEIPNALVMTPIARWSNDQVWDYLFQNNPPPWGMRHDFMLDLYRQANGGECPVVLDLNTPSCGGSRFGCWTCTVVKQDKSMQGFLDSGELWMKPLAEFRDNLKAWREREELRNLVRRNGEPGPGPFTLAARKMILGELLATERRVERVLIGDEELRLIQYHWRRDGDATDSAIRLAERYGRRPAPEEEGVVMPDANKSLMFDLAEEYEIPDQWIEDLLYLVDKKYPFMDQANHAGLLEDVKRVIENAAQQGDLATP
jgi:DNA sulfur modification protein DndC